MRTISPLAAVLAAAVSASGAAAEPPAPAGPAMDGKAFFKIARPCMLQTELPDWMKTMIERRTDPKAAKQAARMAQQCHAVVAELTRKGAPADCTVAMGGFETLAKQLTAELSGQHGALDSSALDDKAMDRCAKTLGLPMDGNG